MFFWKKKKRKKTHENCRCACIFPPSVNFCGLISKNIVFASYIEPHASVRRACDIRPVASTARRLHCLVYPTVSLLLHCMTMRTITITSWSYYSKVFEHSYIIVIECSWRYRDACREYNYIKNNIILLMFYNYTEGLTITNYSHGAGEIFV